MRNLRPVFAVDSREVETSRERIRAGLSHAPPVIAIVPPKARAKRIDEHDPPAPDDGFHVYRMQCSACPEFFSAHVSHDAIQAELHSGWFEQTSEEFREHYVDHPGRVAPCGGHCVVTLNGEPFEVPS